jgi:hypothetical protein
VTEQPSSAEAPTNEILIHARREYRKEHGVWPSRSWKPLGRHLAASAAAVAKGRAPKPQRHSTQHPPSLSRAHSANSAPTTPSARSTGILDGGEPIPTVDPPDL